MKRDALLTSLHPAFFRNCPAEVTVLSACKEIPSGSAFLPGDPVHLADAAERFDRIFLHTDPYPASGKVRGTEAFSCYVTDYLASLERQFNTEFLFLPSCSRSAAQNGRSFTSVQLYLQSCAITGRKAASEYAAWLETASCNTIRTEVDCSRFIISAFGIPLIKMRHAGVPGEAGEGLYRITGGMLAGEGSTPGYFHFLCERKKGIVYTALTSFTPALLRPLYRMTQAPLHEAVMKRYVQRASWKSR
ncbi:hypothetical protein [Alteribacter natronophilus]|uniref:hypothetical protein n=1 Tax=Alteribacter natronophilus TaxID=2583810 RepID=UPI00110E6ED4|nr:hypothetical protein [Alteribacter natronophilus]TMW73345.1 hypothetical protein FGB90_03280 [Alteribacter natronophilus]